MNSAEGIGDKVAEVMTLDQGLLVTCLQGLLGCGVKIKVDIQIFNWVSSHQNLTLYSEKSESLAIPDIHALRPGR